MVSNERQSLTIVIIELNYFLNVYICGNYYISVPTLTGILFRESY